MTRVNAIACPGRSGGRKGEPRFQVSVRGPLSIVNVPGWLAVSPGGAGVFVGLAPRAVRLSLRCGWGAVLVVGDEICDGNKVAVRAWAARAQASAPGVAVLAALDAEVAGLALRAFVDGVDLGGLGGSGCGPAASPGGLAAGVGAPSAASDGGETGSALLAHAAGHRIGIVTHAGCHGGGPFARAVGCAGRGGRDVVVATGR